MVSHSYSNLLARTFNVIALLSEAGGAKRGTYIRYVEPCEIVIETYSHSHQGIKSCLHKPLFGQQDFLRDASDKLGTIQRSVAWPLNTMLFVEQLPNTETKL
eukprot:3256721-Amphidinium_carterae.1